jgi:hypothetical protein
LNPESIANQIREGKAGGRFVLDAIHNPFLCLFYGSINFNISIAKKSSASILYSVYDLYRYTITINIAQCARDEFIIDEIGASNKRKGRGGSSRENGPGRRAGAGRSLLAVVLLS